MRGENQIEQLLNETVPIPYEQEFDLSLFPDKGEIDRNSRCPCRSGKKFKKCHGLPDRSALNVRWSPFPALALYDLIQDAKGKK